MRNKKSETILINSNDKPVKNMNAETKEVVDLFTAFLSDEFITPTKQNPKLSGIISN